LKINVFYLGSNTLGGNASSGIAFNQPSLFGSMGGIGQSDQFSLNIGGGFGGPSQNSQFNPGNVESTSKSMIPISGQNIGSTGIYTF
jgi:hypothetical protein